MNAKVETVGFGAPAAFGAHIFRVEIPASRTGEILLVEDYGYEGNEGGIPGSEDRVVLGRGAWTKIADVARREFNPRLKAAKLPVGRWRSGTNKVERLLGRELCVLAWAAERADKDELPVVASKWAALRPEERWWLFMVTVAEAGLVGDHQRGWRRARTPGTCRRQRPAALRTRASARRSGCCDWLALCEAGMTLPAVAIQPGVTPFALKDAPALIERLLPVQKLSAEAYKEQMAVGGKTLVALGSYWKGRKPLVLAKACILGCLLPATKDPKRDLEIFEMLMGMDALSFAARAKRKPSPREIVATLPLANIEDYFQVTPSSALPQSSPVDWSDPEYKGVKVAWHPDLPTGGRRNLEAQMLSGDSYRERVAKSRRPEEVPDVHEHIWEDVNAHLGTNAHSIPELVEQIGVMRFGHRPKVADTFCGSGQIPFEAARLGCDVYASDLNPVACMLTWGAFHVIGGSLTKRQEIERNRRTLAESVQAEIGRLGVEEDGTGWKAKAFLYCVEVRCPQTGWLVPLLPSRVVSKKRRVIAELVPDPEHKRYDIRITSGVTDKALSNATAGTVCREKRGTKPFVVHEVAGKHYKTNITTLRGDFERPDGSLGNKLRLWSKDDVIPRADDLLQERLYGVQWMRPRQDTSRFEYAFRSVTEGDIKREQIVESYVAAHLSDWQANGWVPDMRIEVQKTSQSKTRELVRTRGWTHWHHLFNPRQLLLGALINRHSDASMKFGLGQALNRNCRLSLWDSGIEAIANAFYNQALNPLFNYGCRGSRLALGSAPDEIQTGGFCRRPTTCLGLRASGGGRHALGPVYHRPALRQRRSVRGDPRFFCRMVARNSSSRVR